MQGATYSTCLYIYAYACICKELTEFVFVDAIRACSRLWPCMISVKVTITEIQSPSWHELMCLNKRGIMQAFNPSKWITMAERLAFSSWSACRFQAGKQGLICRALSSPSRVHPCWSALSTTHRRSLNPTLSIYRIPVPDPTCIITFSNPLLLSEWNMTYFYLNLAPPFIRRLIHLNGAF